MLLDRSTPERPVLVSAATGEVVTVSGLQSLASLLAGGLEPRLAFLFADGSVAAAARFLALLEAGVPVLPLDARTDSQSAALLLDRYEPDLVLLPEASPVAELLAGGSWEAEGVWRADRPGPAVHADLAVLLSTSGSTGSPKLVRLSRGNMLANARAIAASLNLRTEDRAVTSLPLFYSFGMSLLTSHTVAGSSVLVTGSSVIEPQFWDDLAEHRVTHLAGVPQTYRMLQRLKFHSKQLPHLRALLQAGGRLAPEVVAEFADAGRESGRDFFVMYGQTEAAPRMACLPPERLPEKLGSAGLALQGGRFDIIGADGEVLAPGGIGEVVYTGPNVMMGYAESRADLALGDQTGGTLRTGDVGYLDDEGFLFLTGRTKRIAKISGVRVSLDEIETRLEALAPVAVVAAPDDGVVVFTADTGTADAAVTKIRRSLARDLGASHKLLDFRRVPALPLLPSGKVDYARLTRMGAANDT